jgi:predicted transcriptional regulator
MTQDHPSITEQIEAVELAVKYLDDATRELGDLGVVGAVVHGLAQYKAALVAACETLRTLEFARETLG